MVIRRKLNSQSGASIVIALLFFLLCLTVGAVVLTAATANVGRVARIQNEQQAYFAVRSAAELLRDEIKGTQYHDRYEKWQTGSEERAGKIQNPNPAPQFTPNSADLSNLMALIQGDAKNVFANDSQNKTNTLDQREFFVEAGSEMCAVTVTWQMGTDYQLTFWLDTKDTEKYHNPMTLTMKPSLSQKSDTRVVTWTTTSTSTVDGETHTVTHHHTGYIDYQTVDVVWDTGIVTKGGAPIAP